MNDGEFRQLPSDEIDEELEEEWIRETDEPDIRGVGANKPRDDDWRVQVNVAEFLREEPLESDLRRALDAALRSVEGVTDVIEEDREQWAVIGSPTGEGLLKAVALVVDNLADRARLYVDSL